MDKNVTIEFSAKTILWVLSALLVIWLTITLRDVLITVVLAFILATAITPLVDYLEKKKVPRTVSVAGVILAVIGILYAVVRLVMPPLVSEVTNLISNQAEYAQKLGSYLQNFSPALRDNLTGILNNFFGSLSNIDTSGLLAGAQGLFNGLLEVILVFVLCFYLLLENKGVEGAVVAYVPKQHQKRTLSIYRQIANKMTSWLRGQAIIGIIVFMVSLIGLTILKVNYALTLAILAGLLEALPIIGPLVAGVLAVLIALTQSPILAIIVAVFYLTYQQLEGQIIIPFVMKKNLNLNPIAVILSIIIGGKLLGLVGILIAVPVAAAIGVLLGEFVKKQEEEAK